MNRPPPPGPISTTPIAGRDARKRRAVRPDPRPATAPARPDGKAPLPPPARDALEPFDETDLRALRSGWTFVE